MELNVIGYTENGMYHDCTDENGKLWRIDIMISGYFPKGINPEHLVGMKFTCDWHHPYISIAEGVK